MLQPSVHAFLPPSATSANATPSKRVKSANAHDKPELTIVLLCSDLGLQVLGVHVLVVLVVVGWFALPAAETAAAATAAAREQRTAENQALQGSDSFRTTHPTIHPDYRLFRLHFNIRRCAFIAGLPWKRRCTGGLLLKGGRR